MSYKEISKTSDKFVSGSFFAKGRNIHEEDIVKSVVAMLKFYREGSYENERDITKISECIYIS